MTDTTVFMAKGSLFITFLCLFCSPSLAYHYDLEGDMSALQHTLLLSEGPMWAPKDSPYPNPGASYIELNVTTDTEGDVSSATGILHAVFVSGEGSLAYVGLEQSDLVGELGFHLCCSSDDIAAGVCDQLDYPIIRSDAPANAITQFHTPFTRTAPAKDVSPARASLSIRYNNTESGEKDVVLIVCDATNYTDIRSLSGAVEYRNPYGFVPGARYAFPPFYVLLSVAYCLLFLLYLCSYVYHREHLLLLQSAVLLVIFVGLCESVLWMYTYVTNNSSGTPPCCPVLPTVVAAVVFNVFKKGFSRWLLLSVSLGFGVVNQRLAPKTLAYVTALTLLYLGFGLIVELEEATQSEIKNTTWAFPLFVVDIAFAVCIQSALAVIRQQLKASSQRVKLEMYDTLSRTLIAFIVVWLLCTMLVGTLETGLVDVAWRYLWIAFKVWDVLYLLLLVVIAYLWRPSEQSYQYAWYAQPIAEDEDDDQGVELGAAGVAVSTFQLGDSDSDGEEDSDDVEAGAGGAGASRVREAVAKAPRGASARDADFPVLSGSMGDGDSDGQEEDEIVVDFSRAGRTIDKGRLQD